MIAAILFSTLASCNKKPEYIPGSTVLGYRAPISKILFSPIAFDGATVAVEGIVANLKQNEGKSKEVVTNFKLADLDGNYINIVMPGTWKIVDKEYLVVGGIYRKNGNIIEADQFEKIVLQDKKK
ncbi:MAG: hypothetical protein ACHQ6U_05025 [Thermodesulfobacteriota bacterium]